ncbi:MAG: hypothetical protein V4641_12820 [Pseudomonadota bacterium]|jgi:hypothetical protein
MAHTKFSRSAVSAILWSQWAYWCSLGIAIWAYIAMPKGNIRDCLVLAPIAPGVLIFGVSYWLYQSCDEYVKQRTLQAATLTAVAVAMLAMVYFFLELLGFPKLSMMWVHIVGWSLFNVQMLRLWFEAK